MSIFSDARQVFYDAASDVWTEVQQIFDVATADRFNWRDLVQKMEEGAPGGLQVPYVVAQWSPAVSSGAFGLHNDSYEQSVGLWYVTSTHMADGRPKGAKDTYSELESRYLAMRTYLYAYAGGKATILEASLDISDTNAANAYYLGSNLPFYAALITVRFSIGEPHAT